MRAPVRGPAEPAAGLPRAVAHRLAAPLLAVVGWELLTRSAHDVFFPPPSAIADRMHQLWLSGPASHLFLTPDVVEDLLPSLARMSAGLAVAVVVGVCGGLALGRCERGSAYLDPLLQFVRAIPPPTLVPVFVVLLHLGTTMQVTSIAVSAVWPVLLNTADGARGVDPLQLATAEVFGLSPGERLWRVILPATLPRTFAGLRLSLSLALILMVFSELLPGTANGIGFELMNAQSRFDLTAVWSAVILLGLLGYLLNTLLLVLERRALSWHHLSHPTADR